jgi:hypothetical protein
VSSLPSDLPQIIRRRKQRRFAVGLARRLESGMDPDTAAIEAVRENYSSITRPMSALRRAKKLLSEKPWINQGLELLFAHAGLPSGPPRCTSGTCWVG